MSNWDTYAAGGGPSAVFMQQLLSNLTRVKKESLSQIEGDTASSWQVSSDGKTYTFKLNKNVVWSDGKPFTSADVLYNFKRAADPKFSYNNGRVELVDTVDAPDPYTLTVTLKRPSNSFLPNTSTPFMLMYPAHITDMATWRSSPVGTGPFVFKGYDKGVSYTYRRNPNYYLKDAAGQQLPYLDGIDYHIITDKAFALAAFRTGKLDCGCGYDQDFIAEAVDQLKKDIPGIKLWTYYSFVQSLQFNLTRPPFNNVAFRQAVAIGFDKEKVAATYRGGTSFRSGSPLIPSELGGQWGLPKSELAKIPGYNPDHSVDLALAQQKFRESGIDPKSVNVELMHSPYVGDAGALLATVLSEIGLKVTPKLAQPADSTKRLLDGAFDIWHLTPGPAIDDPADHYAQLVTASGRENFGKYASQRVDRLLQDQDSEIDAVKRRAMLWEVQRIHLTEFPTAPMYYAALVVGTQPYVFGYQRTANVHSSLRLESVWLSR